MKGTAFITGATSGFGKACAELFAQDGWNLVLVARRTDRLEELKAQLEGDIAVHTMTLDVRERSAVKDAVAGLPAQFADVDLLLNNAGLALGLAPAHKVDLDDWDTMVDTNIKGMMYCTHALLPGMVERNRGHIFNLGSVGGDWPYPNGNVYCATKAFVKQFSLTLRADLVATRIRVTNIEPGLAETEFSLVRFKGDRDTAATVYENLQPLSAADIADIIFWAAGLPPHVNINRIEVMPVCQALGPMVLHREQ